MKDTILRALFFMFAICLILSAIAFNLEIIKLCLISFGASLAFAILMVITERIFPNKDRTSGAKKPTEVIGK